MKRSRLTGLLLLLWGSQVLLNNLGKSRVAALHVPDILGLIACGMLFGVGLVWLIGGIRIGTSKPSESANDETKTSTN